MCDAFRAAGVNVTLLHGEEAGREIGKRPTLTAGVAEIDITHGSWLEDAALIAGRKRK